MPDPEDWTVATLKEFIMRTLDERDRRYTERFEAQERAVTSTLAAHERTVAAALEATRRAIDKAEDAQRGVNERGNEFRASLDDYTKTMLPRPEADQRFSSIRDLIDKNTALMNGLLRGESRGAGGVQASEKAQAQNNWRIGLAVAVAMGLLGMFVTFAYFLAGR